MLDVLTTIIFIASVFAFVFSITSPKSWNALTTFTSELIFIAVVFVWNEVRILNVNFSYNSISYSLNMINENVITFMKYPNHTKRNSLPIYFHLYQCNTMIHPKVQVHICSNCSMVFQVLQFPNFQTLDSFQCKKLWKILMI